MAGFGESDFFYLSILSVTLLRFNQCNVLYPEPELDKYENQLTIEGCLARSASAHSLGFSH